jgi:hypothetical protein
VLYCAIYYLFGFCYSRSCRNIADELATAHQDGITEFSRLDAEDIFDRTLPGGSEGAPAQLHAPAVLALLAVVGSNGLSSDEREFVQSRGTGYSAYGGTGTTCVGVSARCMTAATFACGARNACSTAMRFLMLPPPPLPLTRTQHNRTALTPPLAWCCSLL